MLQLITVLLLYVSLCMTSTALLERLRGWVFGTRQQSRTVHRQWCLPSSLRTGMAASAGPHWMPAYVSMLSIRVRRKTPCLACQGGPRNARHKGFPSSCCLITPRDQRPRRWYW